MPGVENGEKLANEMYKWSQLELAAMDLNVP